MSTISREDVPVTLGTHCAERSCNDLDFLPIRCNHCSLIFCRHHSSPPAHSCIKDPNNRIVTDGGRFADKFNDLLPDPNRLVGERAATEKAREDKTEAARKVLEKNFGKEAVAQLGTRAASGSSAGSAPKKAKISPVIALMKLKQRAKPVDAKSKDVSMDDRLYLRVELLEGEDRVKKADKELFLAKVGSAARPRSSTSADSPWPQMTTSGRALDQFASLFGLTNSNNTSTDPSKVSSAFPSGVQLAFSSLTHLHP
jgi:hypothetical protein